jgi:NADP-dependent 3-hydroxy acid dehydrogenase YdfG
MSSTSTPVFLITGASSGFGEAIAHEALSRGHHVIATARSASKLGALRAAGAAVLDLDVTSDEATLAGVFGAAHAVHGRITHVVNCAGYILEGAVEEAR